MYGLMQMERVHLALAAAARLAGDMAGDDSQQHLRDDGVLSDHDKLQQIAVEACLRMHCNPFLLICQWQSVAAALL